VRPESQSRDAGKRTVADACGLRFTDGADGRGDAARGVDSLLSLSRPLNYLVLCSFPPQKNATTLPGVQESADRECVKAAFVERVTGFEVLGELPVQQNLLRAGVEPSFASCFLGKAAALLLHSKDTAAIHM
jgi:hypothetical protein